MHLHEHCTDPFSFPVHQGRLQPSSFPDPTFSEPYTFPVNSHQTPFLESTFRNPYIVREPCHFSCLPVNVRHKIYKYALDINTPRKVFIHYSSTWKDVNLTRAEKCLHAAEVLNVDDTSKTGLTRYNIREYTRSEARKLTRALWPSLLWVCRDIRAEASKVFYTHAKFIAPGDGFTIPEWEARLPFTALTHLTTNPNLAMAHICGELQQWKCLRNYLYNPARQAYQVSAPAKVTAYWGPYEVTHRQQIKSIPWQFTELSRFQVWNKYPPGHEDKMPHDHIVGSLSDMFPNHLLADHRLALHECLQYEFLQEYQRIHRIPTPQDRDPQLLHLADGMRTFLTKLVCKWALKGVLELQNWLVPWLADPLRVRLPVVGFERVFEGGLFFGVHLFQRDMLGFVREVQRNAKKNLVSREKSWPSKWSLEEGGDEDGVGEDE